MDHIWSPKLQGPIGIIFMICNEYNFPFPMGMTKEHWENTIIALYWFHFRQKREEIDLRNTADQLVYKTEKQIEELGDKLDNSIKKLDKNADDYYIKMQKVIEDHAIEASICKIIGSEALA